MARQNGIDKAIAKLDDQIDVLMKARAVLESTKPPTATKARKPRPVAVDRTAKEAVGA